VRADAQTLARILKIAGVRPKQIDKAVSVFNSEGFRVVDADDLICDGPSTPR
jgi:hypothetical protein